MADSETPYRFEEADNHCVVTLLPELNQAPWGDINAIGTSLIQSMQRHMETHKKSPAFLVDLSHLSYIGSAMVALVVRLWKAAKEKDGRVVVVNNDDMVLEVLRLSGLEKVWTIVETREAGMKSLGLTVRKPAPSATTSGGGPQLVSATSSPSIPQDGTAGPWAIASLVLLVTALVGLFLFTADPPPVADLRIAMAMLFGGCVLALIPGTVAASRGAGLPKTLGATVVVGALVLLIAGIACHPKQEDVLLIPAQGPIPHDNPAGNGNGENNKSNGKSESKTNSGKKTTSQSTVGKTAKSPAKSAEKTAKTAAAVAPRPKPQP